ncbi:sigma-like protein [Streptomyces longwoodensis]|uniref:sigma-like protein n=1 Tax=Streptomyces longwoodensis TaxID=68231 RepID=UPI00224EA7C0|nr:sigma-like protein [Streptomyces longwoodensis]MCX4994333.1 sigma-like protein [Streptomyces longwoodensis]
MSEDKKIQGEEIVTLDNHAPAPPKDGPVVALGSQAPAPSADTAITTMDNHAPAPPALDLGGK